MGTSGRSRLCSRGRLVRGCARSAQLRWSGTTQQLGFTSGSLTRPFGPRGGRGVRPYTRRFMSACTIARQWLCCAPRSASLHLARIADPKKLPSGSRGLSGIARSGMIAPLAGRVRFGRARTPPSRSVRFGAAQLQVEPINSLLGGQLRRCSEVAFGWRSASALRRETPPPPRALAPEGGGIPLVDGN